MSELARMIEGFNKHLTFAKEAIVEGWNARTDRARSFNLQAAFKILENVILEGDFLIDALYQESSAKVKKTNEKRSAEP